MSILRQRRLFLIMAMISILACVNWLISTRKFESIQIFENKKQMSLYFHSNYSTGQQNEDLSTFSIETTNTQVETTSNEIFTEMPTLLILKRLILVDFIDILKLFHSNKVSLLDVGILENIKISKNSNHSVKVNLLKTLKLNKYFKTSTKLEVNQIVLTFGTSYLGFGKLYKVIKQFNIKYESKLRMKFFERS